MSLVSKALTAALYPGENIEILDEIHPVNVEVREVDTTTVAVLLRLPENDQVKSNVRRITIERDFGGITPEFLETQVWQLK